MTYQNCIFHVDIVRFDANYSAFTDKTKFVCVYYSYCCSCFLFFPSTGFRCFSKRSRSSSGVRQIPEEFELDSNFTRGVYARALLSIYRFQKRFYIKRCACLTIRFCIDNQRGRLYTPDAFAPEYD